MPDSSIIVAVASPPGRGPRGIVRGSGPGLVDAAASWFSAALPDRTMVRVAAPLGTGPGLPCLACARLAPRTYTGEDVLELLLPGGAALLRRVTSVLIRGLAEAGHAARHAGPGEFTARAWLNGRMDLSQAEGVAAAIAARGDAELRAARTLLSGSLGRCAAEWIGVAATLLARVEAGIDFTDQDDVVTISAAELAAEVRGLRLSIERLLAGSVALEQVSQLPRIVLAGPPNAGKSSLFNALLGRGRVIASPLAGTTRDAIVEPLVLRRASGEREVLLVDAPGSSADPEVRGVSGQESSPARTAPPAADLHELMRRAADLAQRDADLLLRCRPAGSAAPIDDRSGPPSIDVITMCDVAPDDGRSCPGSVRTSALLGTGLDQLRRRIDERLADAAPPLGDDVLVVSSRGRAAIERAVDALLEIESLVAHADPRSALAQPELAAAGLRTALDRLGDVAGRVDPDAVLDRLFSRFCIGK